MINEPLYRQLWQSELGPVETGTVAVLLPGILAGIMALRQVGGLPARWLAGWLVGWLAGWLAGWRVGLLAGGVAGWLAGWLAGKTFWFR